MTCFSVANKISPEQTESYIISLSVKPLDRRRHEDGSIIYHIIIIIITFSSLDFFSSPAE
jgi:hypothetical protein